jgi:hypothetical protein
VEDFSKPLGIAPGGFDFSQIVFAAGVLEMPPSFGVDKALAKV